MAVKYPVELFDQSIRNFIQMILDTMDIPALEKDGRYNTTTNSCYSPSFELTNGTLFMPEIQDDDPLPSSSSLVFPKRRLSLDTAFPFKKQKTCCHLF
jgi:hypothetical protein